MAIKTYKKGSAEKLSANFKVSEFLCNGTGCCAEGKIDEKLVKILQQIRDHFGKPVYISSAYRCPVWNKQVGGVSSSYHLSGQAADFYIDGVAPAEIAKFAESIGVKGIGLYEEKDGNFVHIDTRNTKSFWYGHGQAYRATFGGASEDERCTVELRILKKGRKGEQIRAIQRLLIGRGFGCGISGADGDFGNATDAALRAFQKAEGLVVDGECDGKTWACLMGV